MDTHGQLNWCHLEDNHIMDSTSEKTLDMSFVSEIRDNTCDNKELRKMFGNDTQHCFEIVTEDRIFTFGCTSLTEKAYWLVCLRMAKDKASLKKLDYVLDMKELKKPEEIAYFTEILRKHGNSDNHVYEFEYFGLLLCKEC